MSISSALENEGGFTIQELLVAIVAGSLLVGFAFSLYLFISRLSARDFHRREHRETAYATVALVARDVEHASKVIEATDSLLILESHGGGRVTYGLREGRLTRNGIPVGPPPGEAWRVRMRASDAGRVALELRSSWKKDSLVIHTEVSPPRSSAGSFSRPHGAGG